VHQIRDACVICAANDFTSFTSNNSAALSDEDKEKIEKLRSSAILRHLNKYTTVSNFLSLFDTHLNISHDDYSSFLPFTIYIPLSLCSESDIE